MVNNNQQQEKSQDFELMELLFGNVDSSTSDSLDKSFEARYQSLVDQIPSYLHSSEKPGFFPHRFLGSFSSVLDTKLNDKLGIKKLHFRFEGARTLKVVAETESKTYIFIFTEEIEAQHSHSPQTRTKNFEFTTGEWKDVVGRDYAKSDERKLQIDVIKILKDKYELVKTKPKSDKDVKSKKLYLYLKRDGVLEYVAKDIHGGNKAIQINRDELKGNNAFKNKFFDEIKQFLGKSGKDLSDDVRKELSKITSAKGYTLKSDGEDEKINIKVESKKKIVDQPIEPTIKFQEVTKKLGKSVYLENYIEKLASPDKKQVQDNLKVILGYTKEVHANLNLQGNFYGIKAREAGQHGFVAGIFDNFRYRDNTKLYLEQFAGGGYADIVLLVRGPNRAIDSVPILIELKAGTEGQVDPSDALRQAEDYIKGFRPNKMRILTNADNAIAVGLNLDNAEPFKTEVKPIKRPLALLMEEFIELIGKWDNQSAYEEVFKREVKDLLSSEYHTFPANKETKDHYYFSRDILGQSILINKIGQDQGNVKKYIYSYGEYPLNWPQGTEYTLSNSPVTTLIFVQGNEGQEKTAFIFHIRESNTKEFYADKKIPVLNIPKIGKVGNAVEIKMSLKKYETGLSFEDLFEIEQISKYESSGNDQQFTDGKFIEIPNSDELKAKFDQAITSQHASDGEVSLQAYKVLLTEVADTIYPIKDLITNEARLQAVLNGLLSSYSDLKLQETSAKTVIIPEFQVGAGGRVDMVIQGIGPSSQGTKEYTPIALEFKLINKNLDEEGMKKEVDKLTKEQNIRYAKGAALKAITDSDKMLFMGVVVNVKAKDKNSLILTSDKFVPALVVHSSIHMIHPDTVAQSLGKLNLNDCVGHSSRSKRSNNDCLFSKGDVEEFSKGKVDENNVDKVIIDSEKFLTYVKSSQDKGKNAQLVEFIGNKNIEGDYKYLVDKVIGDQGYERYIQNERIKDLQSDVLQQNSGLTKNPKLKSRLMNAAGRIQLIRGIHGAIVSCTDGTATDCGLNLGGIGWSFASQPIGNAMVRITPKVVASTGNIVGKIIPGTLGRQTKFAIELAGVKFGSTLAKGAAGAVAGAFDIIFIGISANNLIDCKNRENSDNPCGEKEIRDNIATISFSGVSFVSGIALTAASMPVVGIAVGFGLMVGQGVYSGISNIVEYEKKYDTTYGENWSIFWRTILFQDMASDVQHLADRKNTVDSLAKEVWEALNNAPNSVVAYGVGLGKVSDNTLRPDYAKILMDKEDTNTRDLSRVIPNPIPGASRICLPKITTQDYEKGIKNSVQPPLYYCENSMVISHDGRNGKTIVYDLRNIDKGEIVGSNKWNNNFLIYPGTTKITGGNNVENRFVLVNNPSFLGKIIGGSNSINILDLSQLVEDKVTGVIGYHFKPSAYGELKVRINDRLLIDDYVSNNLFNYHYIGRQNKVDEVLCMGYSEHFTESDNRDVIIDSGGGVSRNKKDVVKNCRKVIISPYTTVKGRESNYTFYVKTADYEGKSLYSEIDVHGTGTVNFPEFDLLSDCDQITYSKDSNTLSLKINFGQNDQFTLDIKNYFEQSSNKPHFVLIDKNGSNIVPKIERSDSATIKINSFELHSEHSLGNFKDIENHYKKILNNNKDYKVLSVIRGKTQNQNDGDMVFGSSGDDVINFDQGTMFARGGKGSDVYVITDDINNKEVKIDNNSDDEKVDTLFIPEVEKGFSIQQCDLHLNYSNISIQVKNYLQDHNHRHFIIMNKKGEAFIPNIQLMSCSSPEKGKLVPFLQATQTQNMFLLPKDCADDHIVIDSHLEDIKKYKDKDDLLMIRESEIPFIIRIEGFYTDRSKWENISYSLWNNNDLLPSPELLEDVDSVMEYQDKLRDDYKKVAKEYIIDFSNSINIEHNQKLEKHILTFVGQEEERIGVMILKNVAPDQIEVSSRDIDLILRDKRSNHTVNIKGWNNNKSYRISTLEFDLGLEPITIHRLDRFSLSEVEKIQDLIGKASENYQNRDKYTPKTENDFKCLISIDSFESENRNPTYQCLVFSSLQDQISFTENFCSLEQLTEFRDKSNSTQVSALSKNLQNDLSLSGYDQNIADKCSKLILAEENNQQSKISSMVKSVEESTFLGQSENKLDLGRCLSERKKRSSDFCPAFLENIYNELNREESERRNIVIEESSVRVIASDHETLDIENLPIREVVINDNINRKRSLRSTLDLRKLVQQINEDLGIKPISVVIKDGSDLLIKVSISVDDLQQDVMTVRLKDALINKWYKKLQIIFNNTPMEIDDSLDLKPSLLISDKEIVVITPQDVEEKNKLVISKKAGQYAFLYSGYDLIVTNAFNANMELCIIYFKDFYKEPKMKTLSIRFTDKEILLSDEIDKIYNADSIDKLNYVSSITNLQKSLITSLHLAAQNGDLDQVKLLFDNCGNIEAQDEFGKTPILCAAEAGKWSIVKFLLDNGANINNETTYQETPLHCAVQEGNLDIVKFLFDRGADIESQNAYNEKPLHLAIKAGRLDILKLLLDRGANINAKDKDGKTPLDVAKDQKHDVIIQYLEQAQLNEQLLAAVQDSDFSKVKDLINLGADVNIKDKDGKTPLHYVSRSDHHLGMVKYLISKGADIDVKDNSGRTPEDEERYTNSGTIRQVFMQAHLDKELLLTVKNEKDLKTISDLIVKDIDDRTHGGFYYTWSGNLGTVEFLVSKDVSVNATDKYGCTLLHWSALKGHSDIAKFLVDRGANVNAKDILGRTPIHFAVMNNHVNITELLLNQGVSVDETDKNGSTPLHYAAEFSELDSARFLIEKGANINTADNSGKKPIHVASENNNKNIIELFLSKGVSVDNADKDGWTSLHYAARRGCLGATEFLIEKGADTKAKDKNGQVPLCVAAQYNKPDIIDFLLNRGATIEASDFNDGPILKLAYCIKGVMEKINNKEQISHFEELKSKLPESIKNAVFLSKVCIKNLYQNEYLYAASSDFNYDGERRRVFTWIPVDKKDGKFKWKIEPYGDGYSIMNVEFNEYLYAAIDDFNFDKDRRKAFTWIPGGKDEQSLWRLEYFPNSGNIYMMNVEFNEYLYAADYGKYDDNRRRVFTWIPGGYIRQGTWEIENCESIHKKRDIQELDGKAGSDSLEAIKVRARNKSSNSQLLALPGRLDNHLLDGSNRTRVGKFVSQVANTKDNEERDKTVQRKRRHHHGDHNHHHGHLSRNLLAIEQPEITASSGTRPSSWINNCISWAKKLAASTFSIIPALPSQYNIADKNNVKSDNKNIPQTVGWNKFLNNENIALASCVADALDNTPSRRYQGLMSKGVEVVPSRRVAVDFALKKFNSFVEDKIRNLESKEQARVRVELKDAYPEIIASLERGVEFSGNVGLDNVLEKCKKCFCTNVLQKDKVSTCLSDVGVTKLGGNLNR